ncbi:MAG: TolC family protein [Candidatus Enterousia sp.]
MRNAKMTLAVGAVCCGVSCSASMAMDLSLNRAVEMIMDQSQDIKKADAALKQAEAQLDVANSNRWFKLDGTVSYMNLVNVKRPFDGNYGIDLPPAMGGIIKDALQGAGDISHLEIPDNIFSAGVNLTQPIYTFGKIGNAVRSVRSAIKMSEASKEMTRREVKYSAVDLYWTAKMTDDIVKLSEADLRDAKNARASLTAAGRANRSNLVKIESDIATKEINLSDAKFNRDTAHRMLKILAGIDINEELTLTDNFPASFGDLNAGELKDTPQWQILSSQVKMYEDKARSQRANNYPTLAATASYSYNAMNSDFHNMFSRDNSQSANWGIALQVPIFSGGLNRANATVDAMNAESARQDLDKAKKITTEEYERAIAQYDHLRGNLATLENARNLAAKAYKFSSERFASGQTSAIELSEVSAGLYQLDMALLNAKYKILMSAESIKKLGE